MFSTLAALLVLAGPVQSSARPKVLWTSAQWKADRPENVAAIKRLEVLKFGPKRDIAAVHDLIRRHVVPLKRKIERLGVLDKHMDVNEMFWPVALQAYDPVEVARFKVRLMDFPLVSCNLEPTYEFARVGFVVLTRDAGYRGPQKELATRLLQRKPNDLLVQMSFIEMCSLLHGFSKDYQGKAIEFADSFEARMPYRYDIASQYKIRAYESNMASMKKSAYEKLKKVWDHVISDPRTSAELRANCESRRKYYKSIEHKIGWKG